MSIEQRSLHQIAEVDFHEPPRVWGVTGNGLLLALPAASLKDYQAVFDQSGLCLLDQPPTASEVGNYESVAILEAEPGSGNALSTRSIWKAQSGSHGLGALFPSLRHTFSEFETLTGVLFPQTVKFEGNISGEIIDPWIGTLSSQPVFCISRVLNRAEQSQSLESLLYPRKGPYKLAVFGLGDIGRYVTQSLFARDTRETNISSLLFTSGNPNNVLRMAREMEDTQDYHRLTGRKTPDIVPVLPNQIERLFDADVILFLASGNIPKPDAKSLKIDVRSEQFEANSRIVETLAQISRQRNWKGTLLMASDPIEQLAMEAFREFFQSAGGNNQRIAGFGAAINYARALNQAEKMGIPPESVEIFGPHGKSVVAIPYLEKFDPHQAELLSLRTGLRNYDFRRLKMKPWMAPAQLMVDALVKMLNGQPTYASPFLPGPNPGNGDQGAYFGVHAVIDPERGTMTPVVKRPEASEVSRIIARSHYLVAETSHHPEKLHIDPFRHASSPDTATHPAFHDHVLFQWQKEAARFLSDLRRPYVEREKISSQMTNDMLRAIVRKNRSDERTAKRKFRELVNISLRKERDKWREETDLIAFGIKGGEILSGLQFGEIAEASGIIIKKADIHSLISLTIEQLQKRNNPKVRILPESSLNRHLPVKIAVSPDHPAAGIFPRLIFERQHDRVGKTAVLNPRIFIRTMSELDMFLAGSEKVSDIPLELLKYPHLAVRQKAWQRFNTLLNQTREISPELAKKILTLCHFGDDFTLYQVLPDWEENRSLLTKMLNDQANVLYEFSKRGKTFARKKITQAVIMGATGAPIGQHHVKVLDAGLSAIRDRYQDGYAEGYISLDDFSRTKADKILSGKFPDLPLRRRIAYLQMINNLNLHLIMPSVPIWFDQENEDLYDQMTRAVPHDAKVWRFISGDALPKYPSSQVYRKIPHVTDMRREDRKEMDRHLNRLHFDEFVVTDSRDTRSSTQIRRKLKRGSRTNDLNPLSKAFIRHYGISFD